MTDTLPMTDTISSASKTITSQLSSSGPSFLGQPDCTVSNIRFLIFTCLLFLFVCVWLSLISQMSFVSQMSSESHHPKCTCGCARRATQENFSNDDLYAYSSASSASYQSIPLTSPNTNENAPSNLLFGQANRYISANDDVMVYTLDITANLYVLNGNVFQKGDPPNHSYIAYLSNDTRQIELGELKKSGDGTYKLKFSSQKVQELVSMRSLSIVYDNDTEKQTLLVGQFS